jgi:hypothetical protein
MADMRVERTDQVIAMPLGLDRVVAALADTTLDRSGTGSVFMMTAARNEADQDVVDVTVTRRALDGTTERLVRLEPVECDDGSALLIRPEVVGLDWDANVRDKFLGSLEDAARRGGFDYLRMHSHDAPEFGLHMAQRGWEFLPGYDEADLIDGDGFDGCPALAALDATLTASGVPPLGLHVHQYRSLADRITDAVKDVTGCDPSIANELFGDHGVLSGLRTFLGAIAPNPGVPTRYIGNGESRVGNSDGTPHTLADLREFANNSPDAFAAFHMIRRSLQPSEWLEVLAAPLVEDDTPSDETLTEDERPLNFGAAWVSAVPWFGELKLT